MKSTAAAAPYVTPTILNCPRSGRQACSIHWTVAGAVQTAGRDLATRPGKLQLDAVVAVGGDGLAGYAHDGGRLRAVHGELGMQTHSVFGVAQGAVRRVGSEHDYALAVYSWVASFAAFFLPSSACVSVPAKVPSPLAALILRHA